MTCPRVLLAFALCAAAALAQDAPQVKLDGDDVPKGKPCSSGKQGCLEFEWGEYQGEVEDNVAHGDGLQTFKNGDKFHGSLVAGKREGEGTYQFKNGDGYIGDFQKDQRHGWGQFYFKEKGFFWEGPWHSGTQHGEGFVYFEKISQGVFKGKWKKGEQLGDLSQSSHKEVAVEKNRWVGSDSDEL